jgi:hypothetical protein
MGLIHMNGRVQDSKTGRFLSADPFVSEPDFTQSYNRYTYVMNNPMSYTDPSGFQQVQNCTWVPIYEQMFEVEYLRDSPTPNFTGGMQILNATGNFWYRPRGDSMRICFTYVMADPVPEEPRSITQQVGRTKPDRKLLQRTCTFSESVQYKKDVAAAGRAMASTVALGADIARSIHVNSQIIDGELSYRGFDGKTRSFSVNTAAQERALSRAGAVGAVGRLTFAYGAWDSGTTLLDGLRYENSDDVFRGGIGAAGLAVGVLSTPAGIGIGLGAFLGEALFPLDKGVDSAAIINSLRSPCDPAFQSAK